MGLFSSIGSIFCTAVSVVGGFAGTVGSTLLRIVTNPTTWKVIAEVVNTIGNLLKILPDNADPEKHGEKVLAAADAGITPDGFSSFEEYSNTIKAFEVNPDIKGKWSKEEKIAASAGVVAKGLTEFKGFSKDSALSLMMLVAQKSDFFTPERVASLLDKTKDFQIINDYVTNELDHFDRKDVETLLLKNEQSLIPDTSPEVFAEKLRHLRDSE